MLRFIEVLKGNREGLAFPRTIRRQIESLSTPVIDVRNVVEHIEKEIQKNRIELGEPVMLKLADTQDAVVIGGYSLKFSSLSLLIRQLHDLAQVLVNWRVPDTLHAKKPNYRFVQKDSHSSHLN